MHPGLTTWGLLGPTEIQAILKQTHKYMLCVVIVYRAVACSSAWDRFADKSGISCEVDVCDDGWLLRVCMGLSHAHCCNGNTAVGFCGLWTPFRHAWQTLTARLL